MSGKDDDTPTGPPKMTIAPASPGRFRKAMRGMIGIAPNR